MAGVQSLAPYARSLLRLVIGFTFSLHGMQKLFGLFGGMGGGRAHLISLIWVAGFLEVFGGVLILVGLFTAPVAFVLCGEMAVAYFKSHFPQGFLPIQNHGELSVLYCFVFLYLSVAGPGPISADHWLRKKG
jgi:putative oxidoreductase